MPLLFVTTCYLLPLARHTLHWSSCIIACHCHLLPASCFVLIAACCTGQFSKHKYEQRQMGTRQTWGISDWMGEVYGNNWNEVAKVVSTRIPLQMKKHTQSHLKKCWDKCCSNYMKLRVPLFQWESSNFEKWCCCTPKTPGVPLFCRES